MNGDNHSKQFNRREVLKGGGGFGAGLVGIGPNSIPWKEASSDELRRLQDSPEVQSILNDLGINTLPDSAKSAEVRITESAQFAATKIDFEFGTLMYGDINGETSAGFEFSTDSRAGIPSKKYKNVPTDVAAWLIGLSERTIFIRNATGQERKSILSQIPVTESDNPSIYTGSNIDGFNVDIIRKPDGYQNELKAAQKAKIQRYSINLNSAETSTDDGISKKSISPTQVSVDDVTTQGVVDDVTDFIGDVPGALGDCGNAMLGCISAIGVSVFGCGRCLPPCAGSVTGVGIVLCFGCIYLFCDWLLTGYACAGPGGALDCMQNHGYI